MFGSGVIEQDAAAMAAAGETCPRGQLIGRQD
jgi:hypothetical protein